MKKWFTITALTCVVLGGNACKERPAGPEEGDTTIDTTTPPPPPPPGSATLMAAGNIAVCSNNNDEITAQLIDTVPNAVVIALGDNAFPSGSAAAYNDCYGPTWGRFKDRTYAVLGNHDWDSTTASFAGAVSYFGDRAGPAGKHYYSFDVGAWHVIVLNVISGTNPPVAYNSSSEQQAWLAADLQANAGKKCTMAVWHDPRFMSALSDPSFMERTTLSSLWSRLEAGGVDVVLNGNQHWYERMHPMRTDGTRNDSLGIRQFIVGTGGESVVYPAHTHPNNVLTWAAYGVIRFTLRDGSYDWNFQTARGQDPFSDSGTGTCH